MNLTVLKLAQDPEDALMAVYFRWADGPVQKWRPSQKVAELSKEYQGCIETERYLRDDPVARPDPDIVEASDVSLAFFNLEYSGQFEKKLKKEYLTDLPERRAEITREIADLKQLQLEFEAGVIDSGSERVHQAVEKYDPGR